MNPRFATIVGCMLATAFVLIPVRRARADEETLRDVWSVLKMGGVKIGWEHTTVKRLAGSPARISTTAESRMTMRVMGQARETATNETTVETEEGALVSIRAVEKQSAEETTTEIAFEGRKARVTTTSMGSKRDADVELPEGIVGPWMIDRTPRMAGYPAGRTFEAKTFVRQLGGPMVVRAAVAGVEELEIEKGRRISVVRIDQTIEGVPIQVTAWVEKDGASVRTRMRVSGMEIESFRSTKEAALASADEKTPPPDVFEKTLIRVATLFPHARTAESARIRIRPRNGAVAIPDVVDERQTVEATEPGGAVVLRLERRVPKPPATGTRPLKDPSADVAPFLAASSAIQSDDPLLLEKSREAVGVETDAWRAAQAIETWVSKNLTKKNMGVGFASALEVCRNREGDCTEHSVLVAGLCRAAGIPARVVMGLECIQGIWGGHAWNEVWIEGHWYALDATLGYGSVDPFHLAVAKTALAEGSFGKELTSLLSIVGAVDIDVLELTFNGRTLRPADAGEVRLRYENRLFDLSFTAPPGFDLEPVRSSGLAAQLVKASGRAADGSRVRLTVAALDTPADFAPPEVRLTVDGRPATLADKDGRRRVVVRRDDTLFAFEMNPAASEADRKTFDDFLATVDLDPVASSGR